MNHMINANNVAHLIAIALISALIAFAFIDSILIVLVKVRKPRLDNKYYDFHRRHGFIKITMLKFVVSLYITYSLLAPTGNSGALAAPIWAYSVFVIKLFVDFIRKDGSSISNAETNYHDKV